ncbi:MULTISPECIES: DinB family protein [Deefgea]|uniref:Damage-inducible protein DinB n=1 Tax=Deefgea chitinilytica TaxID=570276 RepID=A0ABS2CDT5_9NEIS|nr:MULTISPECIES: DinB family protein [Deefgea]MBM5572313.1 damage-inducible protein DinB [Deefgea chitinilytica]MBM9889549.1 DinB family protein [Deefgea sp. CFH1-16]
MSTATLLHSLFKYKAWANQELFAALQILDPATQHEQLHAAIRILNHIYVVDRIFAAHLQGTSHSYNNTNTPATPTLAALYQDVQESDQWYLDYVAQLNAIQLAETIEFTFIDAQLGRMSREEILAHIITHGGYHRGAVGRIMSQQGISAPRDIYTGFLHLSEPERRHHT